MFIFKDYFQKRKNYKKIKNYINKCPKEYFGYDETHKYLKKDGYNGIKEFFFTEEYSFWHSENYDNQSWGYMVLGHKGQINLSYSQTESLFELAKEKFNEGVNL